MLEGISWGQFLTYLMSALLIYYVGVLLGYRKALLKNKELGNKRVWQPVEYDQPPPATVSEESHFETQIYEEEPEGNLIEGIVHENRDSLEVDELDKMETLSESLLQILENAGTKPDKSKLLQHLRDTIGNYNSHFHPSMRQAINSLIIHEAKAQCNIDISNDEALGLWLRM